MSEIIIKIEDAYLNGFWAYVQSLPHDAVQIIAPKTKNHSAKKVNQAHVDLLKAAKPMRKGLILQQLADEQGYVKTDWQRVNQLAKDMDIQEPIEELLAQLTP